MKKNDWLLITFATTFTYLIYNQTPGINYLILSVLIPALIYINNRQYITKKWYFYLALHLATSAAVFLVDTALSIFAYHVSLFVLMGSTINKDNSMFVRLFGTASSFFMSFHRIYERFTREDKEIKKRPKLLLILSLVISLVILLLFFVIYRGANPLFDRFVKDIDLSWINVPILALFAFASIHYIAFARPFSIESLRIWDSRQMTEPLSQKTTLNQRAYDIFVMISLFLFVGLNLFLLSINILDIRHLYILKVLPKGLSLSDFVHDAVAGIIFSIVIAIVLISIILHHRVYTKTIKMLIYLWIVQNFIMLINAAMRNTWYISHCQLTYLRIGVYIFLLCALIGLALTAYSFYNKKKHWYLFSSNTKAWYLILVFCSLFPWDRMITTFNFSQQKKLDFSYLIDLSDNNLDLLITHYLKHSKEFKSYSSFEEEISDYRLIDIKNHLIKRRKHFLKNYYQADWQSCSWQKEFLKKELQKKGLK